MTDEPDGTEPFTLPEIVSALERNAQELAGYFGSLPEPVFLSGDDLHWGAAHHLVHVTIGHRRVARGLAAAGALPPSPGEASRRYAEVCATYRERLAAVPPAVLQRNPLPPQVPAGATQAEVVAAYTEASAKVREAAAAWSEDDLDRRGMPHPLMGLVSVREMLMFMVFHDRHHLEGVRSRGGAPPQGAAGEGQA